jgi:archaellum component FlaG (FlaF/FlaG flagellin family)
MGEPICELHRDDNDDIFVLVDGVKIAKRGPPNTAQANTWIMLEPGWIVRDVNRGNTIEVRFEGATIH